LTQVGDGGSACSTPSTGGRHGTDDLLLLLILRGSCTSNAAADWGFGRAEMAILVILGRIMDVADPGGGAAVAFTKI